MNDCPHQSQLFRHLPGHAFVRDENSRFVQANLGLARLFGLENPDQIVGHSLHEFEHLKPVAEQLVHLDRQLLTHKNQIRRIDVIPDHNNNLVMLLINKSLFIDPISKRKNVVATGAQLNHQALSFMIKTYFGDKVDVGSFELVDGLDDFKLSSRETQCLFYIIRGRTAKEISEALNLSKRTVEQYIESIKIKMQCDRRSQLIDKAMENGIFNKIPNDLLC